MTPMLDTLIKQSTRKDGRLAPSLALSVYLEENFPQFSGLAVPEKAYMAIHGESSAVCSSGNRKFFLSYNKGYRPTCGTAGCPCMKTAARSADRSNINRKSAQKWREKTGLKSPSQLPGVGDRISATGKLIGKERYEKISATLESRYGVKSYLSASGVQAKGADVAWSETTRAKRIATNIALYGGESALSNKEVRGKVASTMIERHGVVNPMQSEDIRIKVGQTNVARYGATNVLAATSSLYQSIQDTIEERWGYRNAAKNREVAKRITLGQINGTPQEKETFWKNVNDPTWWSSQTKASATTFLSNFVSSPRTIWLHLSENRPDFFEGVSTPQQMIKDLLDSHGVEYVMNDRNLIKPLELDFWLPSARIGIEVNGLYWHAEGRGKGPTYHLGKTLSVEGLGARLLHFWDSEIMSQWDIVSGIILQSIGITASVVAARKCKVGVLGVAEAREFFNANHIQGYHGGTAYGLYSGEELVSAIIYGKPRFGTRYDWEIIRFCNKTGVRVIGSFGKLFAVRPTGSIVSYSDRRLFTGGVYAAVGMTKVGYSRPSFSYTKNYRVLESRVKYQKHRLAKLLPIFDDAKTATENMRLNGYDRVWDCGASVWEMR